jgi:D-psicose/D-tagatose/L-ribulose 3-epimerase
MVIGCHGLVWTGTFDDAARRCCWTEPPGFDLLEIPLVDPYAFDVAAARRVLARGGARHSGFAWST